MNIDLIRNIDIEQSVLSNAMRKEGLLIIKNSKVKSYDFYLEKHKEIFKAILKTYDKENEIDVVLLMEYCQSNNILEKVGGKSYLVEVSSSGIGISQLNAYIGKLKEYKLKRDVLDITKVINQNEDIESKELLNLVQEKVLSIQKVSNTEKTQEEYLMDYLTLKENLYKGESEENTTIKTGLYDLDNAIHGFSNAELITIFAFSAVGKSTIAGQIALNIARKKKKVMYFSLEMTYLQVMDRFVSNVTGIDHKNIKYLNKDKISQEEILKIMTAADNINKYISIYDTRYLNDIIANIQIKKMQNDVDIVFIDYISLIDGVHANDERMRITKITQKLKALANTLNIPIVILAQATQAAEKKNSDNYKPYEKLSDTDIADSASVFRDSDTVLGIYRNTLLDDEKARRDIEVNYSSKDASINPEAVNILVKKCRNSTKKTLAFRWSGKNFRISNYER